MKYVYKSTWHFWTPKTNEDETSNGYTNDVLRMSQYDYELLRAWFLARRAGLPQYLRWRHIHITPIIKRHRKIKLGRWHFTKT